MKAPKKQRSSRAKSTSGPFIQRMNKNRHAQSEAAPFISPKHGAPIQTKLSINQPGDKYEQEADRMADHIMRRPNTREEAPMISRMHAGAPVQRMCQDCQEEMQAPPGGDAHRTFEEATQGAPQSSEIIIQRKCSSCGGAIQMMADNSGSRFASEDLAQSLQQQKGRGTPLPAGIQTQMSQSFGTDFSEVNIHTDSNAVQMNRELNAKAFAHGSDIYFNQGMYQPGTNSGRRLLGHELTHVEQQRGNSAKPLIQRQRDKKKVKWTPGMRAKTHFSSSDWNFGEIVEITSKPWRKHSVEYVKGKRVYFKPDSNKPKGVFTFETSTLRPIKWSPKQDVTFRPGMWVKLVNQSRERGFGASMGRNGEIVQIIKGPIHFNEEPSYLVRKTNPLPKGGKEIQQWHVGVTMMEPAHAPLMLGQQGEVRFNVKVLSTDAFAQTTGLDPSNLPEGKMISLGKLPFSGSNLPGQDFYGALPGVGVGWARAPWPAFPLPAHATGVQWTQSGFGHLSQFSNVPGKPTIGGYRSWALVHGFQSLFSKWTRPVPGRYFVNDNLFRLFSPRSQTLVFRVGSPQHAELIARLIERGRYTQPYTLPTSGLKTKCANCITVPRSQVYGALGGRPVIVTETGVYDITEFGRPSPNDPFTTDQAGRGRTMREWLKNPTIETPSGQIETLQTAEVRSRDVWGARGVAAIRTGGRILLLYGAYKSGKRLHEAAGTPHFRRVVLQETGSWVGGIIGGAAGAAIAGAVACSPTGPGAFVCAAAGFVGGLFLGAAGSVAGALGGDYLADKLDEFDKAIETLGEVYDPIITEWIWGNEPMPEIGYYPPRGYAEDPIEYEEGKKFFLKRYEEEEKRMDLQYRRGF